MVTADGGGHHHVQAVARRADHQVTQQLQEPPGVPRRFRGQQLLGLIQRQHHRRRWRGRVAVQQLPMGRVAQLQQDVAHRCRRPQAGGFDIPQRRAGQMPVAKRGGDGFGQPGGAGQRVALGTHHPQHQKLPVVAL